MGVGDEGAYYARLATGMTANQIRLHHAIYEAVLRSGTQFDIGDSEERVNNAVWAELSQAVGVIAPEGNDTLETAVTAAAVGLGRLGLARVRAIGGSEGLNRSFGQDVGKAIIMNTEVAGAGLFMWAHGMRSSDHTRLFDLSGREPLGPTFTQAFVYSTTEVPTGWVQ